MAQERFTNHSYRLVFAFVTIQFLGMLSVLKFDIQYATQRGQHGLIGKQESKCPSWSLLRDMTAEIAPLNPRLSSIIWFR